MKFSNLVFLGLLGVVCAALNCSSIKHAIRATSSSQCSCIPGFQWNKKTSECLIDCSRVDKAEDRKSSDECNCLYRFIWDPEMLRCVADCKRVLFHHSVSRNKIGGCNCQSYYKWNPETTECELMCSDVRGSTGKRVSTNECECEPDTKWVPHMFLCQPLQEKFFPSPSAQAKAADLQANGQL